MCSLFLCVCLWEGYQLNNYLLQLIVLRYSDEQFQIDFDDFLNCLIRLENASRECLSPSSRTASPLKNKLFCCGTCSTISEMEYKTNRKELCLAFAFGMAFLLQHEKCSAANGKFPHVNRACCINSAAMLKACEECW